MPERREGRGRRIGLELGGRGLAVVLAAGMLVLPAEEKKKESKAEPARPAAKAEAPAKPAAAAPGRVEPVRPGAMAPGRMEPARPGAVAPGRMEPARPGAMAPGRMEPVRPGEPAFGRTETRPGMLPGGGRVPERQVVRTRDGGEIHRGPGGMVREVRTPGGAVIRHSPGGGRYLEVRRPGGRTVFAAGGGRYGYVQGPFRSHGQEFTQRTYYRNGVREARIYRPWAYGGREYQIYTPNHYYRPGFYTWAYTPWNRPVYYGWGWNSRPWYGYYGGYFAPYPSYRSPAFWLTDFLIATTLETAYLSQTSNGAPPPAYQAPLPPEAKDAVAMEVQRQMAQERADQAYNPYPGQPPAQPALFGPNGPRVFMVSGDVTAYAGNQEVGLMEGDILRSPYPISPASEYAQVMVMASRGGLPLHSYVSVRTVDLQEMQNHLQATMDQGLEQLQSGQGRNGLPPVPPEAMGAVKAPYTDDIKPDDQAERELSAVVDDANKSEKDMLAAGGNPPAAQPYAAAPSQAYAPSQPTGGDISLGMSMDQVRGALGEPTSTVNLGARQIYMYPKLKVTFTNGQVTDVQ